MCSRFTKTGSPNSVSRIRLTTAAFFPARRDSIFMSEPAASRPRRSAYGREAHRNRETTFYPRVPVAVAARLGASLRSSSLLLFPERHRHDQLDESDPQLGAEHLRFD